MKSCTINVFTNGEILVPPTRIRIPKYTLRSWENVLAMVTEKVHLRTGAVHRLCTLDGRPVCHHIYLKNNQHYVAVGAEKFKALPYAQSIPSRDIIRQANFTPFVVLFFSLGPPTAVEIQKNINRLCLRIKESKQVKKQRRYSPESMLFARTGFREDLEHTAGGQMKKHAAKLERAKQQRQVSGNPGSALDRGPYQIQRPQTKRSLFTRKNSVMSLYKLFPICIKSNLSLSDTNPGLKVHAGWPYLWQDSCGFLWPFEGSVFNAQNKRSEMAGAAEVQEDRQLKADLPIDQVEAKIVDEEYENGSCRASPCKASLHDSDGSCLQRSLSAGSRKDEAKEREVSSRRHRIRSRMSRFFKVDLQMTHMQKQTGAVVERRAKSERNGK
ncbi:Doublecortin domain-containing protein 2 [Collichthys lucidus]|uniref:Doublecortin domain-containing protein 2 n=1 Tax=Collichthys lucidus TaxID=240159 RepID=A0A4U5VG29_COLLU|nr:Doublecortin domain-containing protein 2 [Collichthys lucidus]